MLDTFGAAPKPKTWSSTANAVPHGLSIEYDELQKLQNNDGVYTITIKMEDLAGNTSSQTRIFSVNRFGSTYLINDQSTKNLLAAGYTRTAPAISIQEINPNEIRDYRVVVSVDGNTITLKEGSQYTANKTSGKDVWNGIVYTIDPSVFMQNGEVAEGNYDILLYSEDSAKNANSNRTNKGSLPINFTIDRSAPVVSVTGIADGDRVRAENRDVTLYYSDSSGIQEIIVYLDDVEYVRLSAEDLAQNPDHYSLELGQSNAYQKLTVTVIDTAGNEQKTEDIRFFLNSSGMQQYLHNTPALVGTLGGAAAAGLAALLITRRRKIKKRA